MERIGDQTPNGHYGSLCVVGLENFNRDVLAQEIPVLILCMPIDTSFFSQLPEIERVQLDYRGTLKICLLEEDFLGAFMERYQVPGTPTFLIFSKGTELERLLGQVSYQELVRFISQSLPGLSVSRF